MDLLEFFSSPDPPDAKGLHTIGVTENSHPFNDAWWPPELIIGWEHSFIHEVYDLLVAIDGCQPGYSDTLEGWKCQSVLDAVTLSAAEGRWIVIPTK